jgi:hypothetical protein
MWNKWAHPGIELSQCGNEEYIKMFGNYFQRHIEDLIREIG